MKIENGEIIELDNEKEYIELSKRRYKEIEEEQ